MTISKQHETAVPTRRSQITDLVRVLLVVEGTNDIQFLRRISRILHAHDPSLPNLGDMEDRGELIFVPFGGGHVAAWTHRLAPLGVPEFHLYDHEVPPSSARRRSPTIGGVAGGLLHRRSSTMIHKQKPLIRLAIAIREQLTPRRTLDGRIAAGIRWKHLRRSDGLGGRVR